MTLDRVKMITMNWQQKKKNKQTQTDNLIKK